MKTERASDPKDSEIVSYHSLPFKPFNWHKLNKQQLRFLLTWLILCAIIIPSGMITRIFELTGIPYSILGINFHLTIYLPLIVCIPICLYFGYLWAAIPAYFSTFFVALIGDMPLPWIFVFSFSNPIGLAVMVMIYRLTSVRLDMRTVPSVVFFIVISFLSALSGSIGSFIWTYTNQVNLHDFFRVWQGWWLGGLIQSVLICLPLMYFFGPLILRYRNKMIQIKERKRENRNQIKIAISVVILIVILYIWIAFQINLMNISDKVQLITHTETQTEVLKAIEVISFPVFVFMFIIIFMGYFFFYFTDYWHLELQKANDELTQKNKKMYHDSIHDALTGIYNRTYLFEILNQHIKTHKAENRSLCLMMIDLDHFKKINDTYGHQTGDKVLVAFAQNVKNTSEDHIFARFGGEEFSLVLPNTEPPEAIQFAELLLKTTRESLIKHNTKKIKITASIGISSLISNDDLNSLIARADNALYTAKDKGRDTVIYHDT
ncbi:GGDEF domain-containing protein [Marinicella sp. W31]|uniref:GGDEF domain-containing protein n=1 Tax=Marinicella sp. W31 TaxID=3023713 RepID=UPI0037577CAC